VRERERSAQDNTTFSTNRSERKRASSWLGDWGEDIKEGATHPHNKFLTHLFRSIILHPRWPPRSSLIGCGRGGRKSVRKGDERERARARARARERERERGACIGR
jgi:hypothetical protein